MWFQTFGGFQWGISNGSASQVVLTLSIATDGAALVAEFNGVQATAHGQG